MIWVLVFAAIALAGLVMVASYAVWLLHKASDVTAEVRVLLEKGGQLAALVGQVQIPQSDGSADDVDSEHTARGGYVTSPRSRMSTS